MAEKQYIRTPRTAIQRDWAHYKDRFLMSTYFGKRACKVSCGSACCYRPKGDFFIAKKIGTTEIHSSRNMKSFIKRLERAVTKTPEIFGEYASSVVEIVSSNRHIGTNGEGMSFVAVDFERPRYEQCMTLYYPCIFLALGDRKKDKACMVYPIRPNVCKNTTKFGLMC